MPDKQLQLGDPGPEVRMRQEERKAFIELTTRSLARFVELSLTGADVVMSDNYFDLPANSTQTVQLELPVGWSLEQARGALRDRRALSLLRRGRAGVSHSTYKYTYTHTCLCGTCLRAGSQ